jgi:hypothetical protein
VERAEVLRILDEELATATTSIINVVTAEVEKVGSELATAIGEKKMDWMIDAATALHGRLFARLRAQEKDFSQK